MSQRARDRRLADHRLGELRHKIGNLTLSLDSNLPFEEIAKRWTAVTGHISSKVGLVHGWSSVRYRRGGRGRE